MKILPITYRGCCYDYYTGLYYVENRYYSPSIGRFINASGTDNNGLSETNSNYSLFTYWENHPTMYIGGNEHEIYRINSIANYLYNKELSNELSDSSNCFNDFIYNQKDEDVKKYRYGFSTTGQSGCGWVATYNALKMLGVLMEPYDIIREYEMSSGLMVYGFSGTNPISIAQFFDKKGYVVNIFFDDYTGTAKKYNVVNIMNYRHSSGGHYVAIKYEDESFKGYNTFCNNTTVDILGKSITTLRGGEYEGDILICISKKE